MAKEEHGLFHFRPETLTKWSIIALVCEDMRTFSAVDLGT